MIIIQTVNLCNKVSQNIERLYRFHTNILLLLLALNNYVDLHCDMELDLVNDIRLSKIDMDILYLYDGFTLAAFA